MKEKQFPLLEKIKSDKGEDINQVIAKLVTFGLYKAATIQAREDEEKRDDLMISATTGLTQNEIENLKTPDYIAIREYIIEQVVFPAEYFFGFDDIKIDKDKPQLFQPLGKKTHIELTTPSVKASRLMNTIEIEDNPLIQSEYIVGACADLSEEEIARLALVDWNQLQNRVNDFLNQASGFFLKTT